MIFSAVASALPNIQVFVSDVRQHITKHTPSFVHIKDANYNVDEMHLKNGIIAGEKADGRIGKRVVEHVKNSFESRYSAHSFSVNPGAICGRSNILLGMPGIRNHKEFSVHESHVESGIHIKENNIKVDKTIVITTELRNENRIHAFDTAPINTIGSIIAGFHEIKDNWAAIKEARNQKLFAEEKEQEIKDGVPEFEAEMLAGEVVEFNEICEETEAKLEAAREKLAEKIKAEVAKDPEFQKVAESYIDLNYLSEFVDKYCDNLTNINAYLEEYRAEVSETQDVAIEKVSSKDWADKLGDYAISFVDVLNESCAQVAADPFVTLGNVAYFVGDTFLPGGLHNFSDAIHGRTSLSDAVKNEAKDISIDVAMCFCCAGILKTGGKLWNPIKNLFKKTQTKVQTRPSWRQSEVDELARYAGRNVETQVSFLNGERCRYGLKGSIRVDTLVDNVVAIEMKNYNLVTNVDGLVNDIVKQALKHQPHLPQGVKQVFKIDARGQVCDGNLKNTITKKVIIKSDCLLTPSDIKFVE